MDLTTGLLKSNEAITGADPTGRFISGVQSGQQARANATANESNRLALDNQEKLQKAISMSVDENHNLVPDLLLKNGHDLGIDQQVLDHAVKYLPAQWDSIKKTAQAKMGIAAINPEESKALDAGTANQGDKALPATAPAASQGWANQPAKASPSQPVQAPTGGSQTFTLPPMEGDSAGTTSANGEITGGKVSVPGSYNEDGTPINPNKSIFQISNEAKGVTPKIDPDVYITKYDAKTVSGLSAADKENKRQGLLNAGIVVPPNDDAALAEGLNTVQRNAVSASFKEVNPLDDTSAGAYVGLQKAAPKVAQDAVAGLSGQGQETTTSRLGNKATTLSNVRSANEIETFNANKNNQTAIEGEFGVPKGTFGSLGSNEGVVKAQSLKSMVSSYKALKSQAKETADFIDNYDEKDATQVAELSQQGATLLRAVNAVASQSGTEADVIRSLKESGIPQTVWDAENKEDAMKLWLTTNPKTNAKLIRNLPRLLKNNVITPKFDTYGVPSESRNKVLGDGWANQPASSKSTTTPSKGGYIEGQTKTNSIGQKLIYKNGTWVKQ